jgi:hypothetical protein
MEQLHGTRVERVNSPKLGKTVAAADGLLTNRKGLILFLRTADCLPIFLFDPENLAIGLLHCGWRGAVGKIFFNGIDRMRKDFSTRPENLKVVLGPSIKSCCNFVEEPVFQSLLPEWNGFLFKRGNRYRLDLDGFVRQTILGTGVLPQNISQIKDCTYDDDRYFSHRRSLEKHQPQARFASLIWLN